MLSSVSRSGGEMGKYAISKQGKDTRLFCFGLPSKLAKGALWLMSALARSRQEDCYKFAVTWGYLVSSGIAWVT